MTERMRTYLRLEEQLVRMDEVGDPLADALRDAIDPIWYGLSANEQAFLNQRVFVEEGKGIELVAAFVVPKGEGPPQEAAPFAFSLESVAA